MSALIIPVALLVGVTVGALGGGGSILTVPVLVYLFGQDARAATTGSLIIVGTTTLIGMLPHLRQGRVRLAQGAVFGVLGVAGAFLGSKLAVLVPPEVLLAAFSVLMFVVAALMTRRRRAVARAEAAGARPADADRGPILTLRPWHVDGPRLALLLATAVACTASEPPARLRAERRAAVPAGVVEGARPAIAVARHDQPLAADVSQKVVARIRQVLEPADADPVAMPDGLEFALVLRRVVVPGGRQRRGRAVQQGHAP